jgi:hypothetical protein
MATVYLAEDLKHDRKVAIKVLKPELAAVLGAERFVVEIKTTASFFARLRVNDEDLGVYSNIEPIGRPFLRRVFGDDGGAFEGMQGDFEPGRLSRIFEKRAGRTDGRRRLEQLTALLATAGPVSLPDGNRSSAPRPASISNGAQPPEMVS